MAKAVITYGINKETSTGASDAHGAQKNLPAAILYRLRSILREREYVPPQTPTTNNAIPPTEPISTPTSEEMHIMASTPQRNPEQHKRHTRARLTIDITDKVEEHAEISAADGEHTNTEQ